MLTFSYMTLPGGVYRPMIPILIEGFSGKRLMDGLLDTGSDRTLFPLRVAHAIGVAIPPAAPSGSIQTAGGVSIAYHLAEVILELRGLGATIRWKTTVGFAPHPLRLVHLGHRGILEFFHSNFKGPTKEVLLDAQQNLPAVP